MWKRIDVLLTVKLRFHISDLRSGKVDEKDDKEDDKEVENDQLVDLLSNVRLPTLKQQTPL